MMTDAQVQQFDEQGAVTIDTPLTPDEIAATCDAFDRLLPFQNGNPRPSLTCSYYDQAIVDIIQHPFFEEIAKQVLQAQNVHFFQTAILTAYPEPNKTFSFWQHVDMQYRTRDFHTVPKNILCSFFLWLTDVNEKRAPMMVRPGSHRVIAAHNENYPGSDGDRPRIAPVPLEKLPSLTTADPIPLIARAGQVSVLTTAAIHGASVNVDDQPRKNLVFTFTADSVTIGLPSGEEAQKQEYQRELRKHLRPERAHIVPDAHP